MTKLLLQTIAAAAVLVLGLSAAAQELTIERYNELEATMDEADVRRAATSPNTPDREAATAEAIATRRAIIRFLSDWIASGELNEDLTEYARNGRSILIENLIQIHSEIGECEEGSRLLVAVADLEDSEDPEMQSAYRAALASVERCEEEQARLAGGPDMEMRGGRRTGVALTVLGGAMAVGGAVWNFTLLDDRSEFRDLEENCTSTLDPCNERAEELSGRLGVGARLGIAGLVVGGIVTGGLGIRAMRRSDDMVPVDASLAFGDGGGSVRVRVQW